MKKHRFADDCPVCRLISDARKLYFGEHRKRLRLLVAENIEPKLKEPEEEWLELHPNGV